MGESSELVCPYKGCDRTFRLTCGLTKHKTLDHSHEAHFCKEPGCGKTFNSWMSLTMHKTNDHGDDKGICKEPGCGKTFSSWSGLKKHKLLHKQNGVKPYSCDECNASFAFKDKLK